jgi:hypothetical protein
MIKAQQDLMKKEMEFQFQSVVKSMKTSMEKEFGAMTKVKDDRNK